MSTQIGEKPLNRVKITWETCCLSSLQVDALHDILQLLFLDAGLKVDETLAKVLSMMVFHKIERIVLECAAFSYDLKIPEEPKTKEF